MKITFPLPADGKTHSYCINCHAEPIKKVYKHGSVGFYCAACGRTSTRYIHLALDDRNWIDETGELHHTTAGAVVRNMEGKYLFLERTEYPPGYNFPAGHVEAGEDALEAAGRELQEETGVKAGKLRHVVTAEVPVDSCSGGADTHEWHVYLEQLHQPAQVTLNDEHRHVVWLTLQEALGRKLPPAIRFLIEHYAVKIEQEAALHPSEDLAIQG